MSEKSDIRMESALAIVSQFLVVADAVDAATGERCRTDLIDNGQKLSGTEFTIHIGQLMSLIAALNEVAGFNPMNVVRILKMLEDPECSEQFKSVADAMDVAIAEEIRKELH